MSAGPYSIGSDVWPGLAKLCEEAGEVQQAAMKLVAMHGAENYDHWDGTDVRERLRDEIADLRAAVDFFVAKNMANVLDARCLDERTTRKRDLFHRWHGEQVSS